MWLAAIAGCGSPSSGPSEPPPDPAIVKTATERLDLVRRAVSAFPEANASLPPCSPRPGIRILALSKAASITGSQRTGDVAGFAAPRTHDGPFADLAIADNQARGVRNLAQLEGLALFAADALTAPVGSSIGLVTRAAVKGRVVVFDLAARPTCASPIEVTGDDVASTYVKKSARSDEIKRKFEYDAEENLREKLTKAIEFVVIPTER